MLALAGLCLVFLTSVNANAISKATLGKSLSKTNTYFKLKILRFFFIIVLCYSKLIYTFPEKNICYYIRDTN